LGNKWKSLGARSWLLAECGSTVNTKVHWHQLWQHLCETWHCLVNARHQFLPPYLCNENQLDALLIFILSLFRQSTATCFRHICSPSSGGILYIYNNWYVLCFSVDCLLASQQTVY